MTTCEKPPLIERIVNLIPGPYIVKCLVFSSILGVPLLLAARFFDTLNTEATLSVFGPLLWQNIVTFSFANFVLLFYAVYGVRYMRSRISAITLRAEWVVSKGGKTPQEIFGPVCKLFPAVVMSILLLAVSLVSVPDQVQHAAGLVSFAFVVVSFPFVYLAYGTFVWVYASTITCLYYLGKQPLRLEEFHEDAHLGLKPFGSLSLSLAFVYFGGLGLVFFSFLSIPATLELAVALLILVGLILFFLPLNVVHHKMREKKQLERDKLKERYRQLMNTLGEPLQSTQVTDLRSVKHLLAVDMMDRQVASIPEWPFDARTLTWLSAIILTVVASIATRYVMIFLQL